jgi:predicted transcriptional regulator
VNRNPASVTEAEWAILEVLWNEDQATVRRLTEVLYPKGGPSDYATVYKLLERLEGKDCVRRERSGGVFVFRPWLERDDLIGRELETLVAKMCGGSLQPLLSNLIKARRLTPRELRELLDLIEDLDQQGKLKKKLRDK